MNRHRSEIAVFVCFFLAVSVAMAKEKDRRSEVYLQVDHLHLRDGLPAGPWGGSMVQVGGRLGIDISTKKDKSGRIVYTRTITGKTRWLPDNAIEVTLDINENGVERGETIRLENFEPKAVVLRKEPTRGSVELLRFVPIFNLNGLYPRSGS